MTAFGKAMRAIMAEKGIRQVDVAAASGVSKSYVNHVLSGYIESVPFDRACKMIDALGMTPDEFRAVELTFEDE